MSMQDPVNILNLPADFFWDVFDAHTAEPLLRKVPMREVDALLERRTEPVTLEPYGGVVVEWKGRA